MKLHLSLCGRGLSADGTSVKVKVSPPEGSDDSIELGETKVVEGSDPDWAEQFSFDYEEGTSRRISVALHNESGSWVCSRSFVVGEILEKKGSVEAKKLTTGGVLIAHLGTATATGSLTLQISGEDLKNLDGMGILRKSDPFFAFMRLNEATGNWDGVHQSETIKNDLSPEWSEVDIDLMKLCDGDLGMRLRIVIFDEDKRKGKNEVMGYLETSVNNILEVKSANQAFTVMVGNEPTGQINVHQAELVDYKDPRVGAAKAMDIAGRIEVVKIAAEEAEKALEQAVEDAEKAKKEAEEARVAAEEKEAAVEVAREQAEAAKAAIGDIEGLLDELDLDA